MFKLTEVRTFDKPVWEQFPLSDVEVGEWGTEELALNRRRGRYESVMKVLKPNQVYKLASYDLPSDFFSLPDSNDMPFVNISTIVGENGMGKSALIELILRLINNTAYALRYAFKDYGEYRLRFVRDIYASLSFVMENRIYIIIQQDNILHMLEGDAEERVDSNVETKELWRFDFEKRTDRNKGICFSDSEDTSPSSGLEHLRVSIKDLCGEALSKFFYTIAINYSAYSYNVLDLMPEYTENYELESYEDPDNTPWRIDNDSRIWMHSIFHKNDSYQFPLVLAPYRKNGNININNEQDLARDRIYSLAISKDSPLVNLLEGKKPYSFLFDINNNFSDYSPQYSYVSPGLEKEIQWIYDPNYFGPDDKINYSRKGVSAFCGKIIDMWSEVVGLNLRSLGRELNKKSKGDGGRALSYLVYKTVKISGNYTKFSSYINDLKTILALTLKGEPDDHACEKEVKKYMSGLYKDETHITLKLRRVIALLIYQHTTTDEPPTTTETVITQKGEVELSVLRKRINDILKNREEKLRLFEDYVWDKKTGIAPHTLRVEELLPAPCLHTDLLFLIDQAPDSINKASNKQPGKLRARALSSGERQLLNVLCTIVYHIFNLLSKFSDNERITSGREDEDLKYPYVNIILDEGELYFHPKYQTQFVKALLKAIGTMQTPNKIVGINIICATHSPFILSDMPTCNILFLENGRPVERYDSRTFCANVYDILANGFFMDRFVGDFAYDKVKVLMHRIQRRDKGIGNSLRDEIELIGDDYIRASLLKRYDEVFSEERNLISEREKLLRRVEEINRKLSEGGDAL